MPHFPALKKTFLQMLGPSIIFAALSLSGGEMLLWPNLVSNVGLRILWPVPLILMLQFAVNMEIERYALVTGKSVESSLVNKAPWLAVIFALTVLAALVWPAWMTTAGNLIAHLIGFQNENARNTGLVIALILLIGSSVVFQKKETYRILEICSRVSLVIALTIIITVVLLNFDRTMFLTGLRGLTAWGYIPSTIPRFDFVAALAYGGVAGVLNLVQGEWIQSKGYGVNTLKKTEVKDIDFTTPASQYNFRSWFRMINAEHFFFFVVANIVSIFLLSYLGALLLPVGSVQGFQVFIAEIAALNARLPRLGTVFGIAGAIIFTMANVTILDAIGRLTYRMCGPLQQSKTPIVQKTFTWLTAPRISQGAILLGILVLLSSLAIPSFKQPFFLLVLSASMSAFTMWIYPPLLLKMNAHLPAVARPSLFRSILVVIAAAFYGMITLWALSAYVPFFVVVILGSIVTAYHVSLLVSFAQQRSRQILK
jgi:hypothetical protein